MRFQFIIFLLFVVGCQQPAEAPQPVEPLPEAAAALVQDDAPKAPLPEMSIYQLEGNWTTQHDKQLQLTAFRGNPVVVAMFFGSCRTACPTIIGDMKRIEKALSDTAAAKTQFVLVTFDPKVDTPDALLKLQEKFELNPDRWTFLHGEPGSIREVASVLDVQYREISEGQFSHTNRITLLDSDGAIRTKVDGLKQPVDPITSAANAMFNLK